MWRWDGSLLEKLMKRYGTTRLAKEVGVSRQALHGWRKGTLLPSLKALTSFAEKVGVNPSAFFVYEGMDASPAADREVGKLERNKEYVFETDSGVMAVVPVDGGVVVRVLERGDDGFLREKERIPIKLNGKQKSG